MEVFRGAERSHTNMLDMITAIPQSYTTCIGQVFPFSS